MDALARLGLRPLQVGWFLLALAASGLATEATDHRSTAVRAVLAVAAYGGWAAALGAMLVPRSTSLTIARILVPAGGAGVLLAAAARDGLDAIAAFALALAAACVVLLVAPSTVDAFVDGSSYGPERRFALRTPAVVAVLAVVAALAIPVGALSGPLLLASQRWGAGVVVLVVGGAIAIGATRSLHQLARRWIVLVPSGLVVHDPLTMPEAQLFLRQTMHRLGPAAADESADVATQDLTAGASGLVLALEVTEPVDLLVRARGEGEVHAVDRVLFCPSRPAALLDAARSHRLPVG